MENSPAQVQNPTQNSAPIANGHVKPNILNIIFVILINLLLSSTVYLLLQNLQLRKTIESFPQTVEPQAIIPTDIPAPPTSSNPKDSKIQQWVQNGCVSYFDGCNSCSMDESGRFACTAIACEQMGEPKCLEYKSNN